MRRNAILGVVGVAATMLISTTGAFAQSFSYATALTGLAGGTATITGDNQVQGDFAGAITPTVNSANLIQFDNVSDPTTNNATTDIILTNYRSIGGNTTASTGTVNFSNAISLTVGGITQTQNLTGTYTINNLSATSGSLSQTFNQSSLAFVFANGTYTVSGFGKTGPGAPNGNATGATGATVSFVQSTAAPEPGSLALLALGALPMVGLVARRRK